MRARPTSEDLNLHTLKLDSLLHLSLSSLSLRALALISLRLSLNVPRCYFLSLCLSPRPLFLREIHSTSEREGEWKGRGKKGWSNLCVALWERCKYNRCRPSGRGQLEKTGGERVRKRLIRRAGRDKKKRAELEIVSKGRVKLSHERKIWINYSLFKYHPASLIFTFDAFNSNT